MKITARRHLTSIRYAVTVELEPGDQPPAVGDKFSALGDMDVVQVVALQDPATQDPATQRPGTVGDRERSMTVETLETIGRLPNLP